MSGKQEMTNPGNWPDPKKLGHPCNPEQSGWHWLSVGDDTLRPFYWCSRSTGWYTSPQVWAGRWRCTPDWKYYGLCPNPGQITAMLAAERERCAKVIESHGISSFPIDDQNPDAEWLNSCLSSCADMVRNLGAVIGAAREVG